MKNDLYTGKINENELLSKTIMFLRFPLIVAVVLIHTKLNNIAIGGHSMIKEGMFPIYDMFYFVISKEFAAVAVPIFFFISGFLFFYNCDMTTDIYIRKLRKRVRTLFVPYVIWNIIVLLLMFCTQLFLSSMTSGNNKLVVDYNWIDYLNIFWAHNGGMPICYQFWFIRDLMVTILFVPLLYFIIKHLGTVGLSLMGIFWIFNLGVKVPGFNISAFFFFSYGAWFSINKRNFVTDFNRWRIPVTFIYLIMVGVYACLWCNKIYVPSFLMNIEILIGLVFVITWIALGIRKQKFHISALLVGGSFFIYAYHGMFIPLFMKFWVKFLQPVNEFILISGYFIIPVLIIIIGLVLYSQLQKRLPLLTAIITGGR